MTRSLEVALVITLLTIIGLVFDLLVGSHLSLTVPSGKGLAQQVTTGIGR